MGRPFGDTPLVIWLNEPPEWSYEDGTLTVRTGERTDFWRETHYGFVRDDGHLWGEAVEGDFSAQVRFDAEYEVLYDQAGLMVRLNERTWVKAGVEFTDGQRHLSVVVTRGQSDWSVRPLDASGPVSLRISRYGGALKVEFSVDDLPFQMLRLAPFPEGGTALVGPMCCSPERGGLTARFWDFTVGDPATELHTEEL